MTVDERLTIVTRAERDRAILELHGELDLAGAPLLAAELQRAQVARAGAVVLDLQNLQFIDSAGLRVILAEHEDATERGQEFALTKGSPQVQRLLAVAGVSGHLRTIASPEDLLLKDANGSGAAAPGSP
jgi:anti-anti-sigma factor